MRIVIEGIKTGSSIATQIKYIIAMKNILSLARIPGIRYVPAICFLIAMLSGCEKEETPETDFTGKSIVYQLVSGSEYDISGTATFKEKNDGSTLIVIKLYGTSGDSFHPVHLHYGTVEQEGEMAAMLYPLNGSTGESITDLKMLADDSPINYAELLIFDGSIRVHLDDGPNKDVILAYNNIGKNRDVSGLTAQQVAICK